MDDWLKQLQETLDTAAQDASERLAEVSKQANQIVEQVVEPTLDQWVDDSLEVLDQVEQALSPTLNQINEQVDNALDAGLLIFDQQVAPWIDETTAPIICIVNPWIQNHPTCIGCQNYHGTVYGEEMLVCAMHPYGPEESTCPDWASGWPTDSENSD